MSILMRLTESRTSRFLCSTSGASIATWQLRHCLDLGTLSFRGLEGIGWKSGNWKGVRIGRGGSNLRSPETNF